MASRLMTLAVWALLAASTVFWAMKIFAPRTALPSQAQLPARGVALGGDWHRLLGQPPVDDDGEGELIDESGRFQLLGVVAPRGAGHSPQGVALIAVGDEPPKAWRTGSVVEGDTVLLSVGPRSVQLGPRGGPATTELTQPEPTPVTPPPRVGGQRPGMAPAGVPSRGVVSGPGAQPVQRSDMADEEDAGEGEEE
jgi:general secretion pathway protein C